MQTELTNLRLDTKLKGTYESYLCGWVMKVTKLENLEGTPVDDKTKRIWLTSTLNANDEMKKAILDTSNFEINNFNLNGHLGAQKELKYDQWYELLMSNARTIDFTRASTPKRAINQHEVRGGRGGRFGGRMPGGRGGRDFRGGRGGRGRGRGAEPASRWTGPNMEMKKEMWFQYDEYQKLTDAQKTKLRDLKSAAAEGRALRQANENQRKAQGNPSATVRENIPWTGSTTSSILPTPTHNINRVLSASTARLSTVPGGSGTPPLPETMTYRGAQYHIGNHNIKYTVSLHDQRHVGALIDGGANGGLGGSDMQTVYESMDRADITGIGDHQISDVCIGTGASLIMTSSGPIIGIFNQYALLGEGNTIHSCGQMRAYGVDVNDVPRRMKGKQRIRHPDGFVIPLNVRNGLAYMDMSLPSDEDMMKYVHVEFTRDIQWNPNRYDDEYEINAMNPTVEELLPDLGHAPDEYFVPEDEMIEKEFIGTHINTHLWGEYNHFDDYIDACIREVHVNRYQRGPVTHDLSQLAPNFGFIPENRILKTIENTTQYGRVETRWPMRQHFKSRSPQYNIRHLPDEFATDAIISSIPAIDDGIKGHGGCKILQYFHGRFTKYRRGEPLSAHSEFPEALKKFIRKVGAPTALMSDNAKNEISAQVDAVLNTYAIDSKQSEPEYQNQNYAERGIQEVKSMTIGLMDRTKTPAKFWLLCALYVIALLNIVASQKLDWITPHQALLGEPPDSSPWMAFHWWEPVYFTDRSVSFPETKEKFGRIIGVAQNQGDLMTWNIWDAESEIMVIRSEVRTARTTVLPNLRAESKITSDGGELLVTASELADVLDPTEEILPRFSPDQLMGMSYLKTQEDGTVLRATVVRKLKDADSLSRKKIKFLLELGEGQLEELIEYGELSRIISEQLDQENGIYDVPYLFQSVIGHQGPLKKGDKEYNGSSYNVLVQWDDGSKTYEPLDIIFKDDPITLAKYAQENGLLQTPGWKRLRTYAKNEKKLGRLLNQAKKANKRYNSKPKYKFGIRIPRTVTEAREFDTRNGNSLWEDAMKSEIDALNAYDTFINKGRIGSLDGFKKIPLRMIFDVKHDLRHRARLVAGGHLTDPTTEGTYSSVVSLRGLRLAILGAELNGLDIIVGDISSAYLESYTREKVYTIAGPEFGELEGCVLQISKALYGLRGSGASWHRKFADTLRDMGFFPCRAEQDIWLRDKGDHYEYVCVYVDDIMHMSRDANKFYEELTLKYKYHLKGVGKPSYHLGGDFFRDNDGTLGWGAKTYVGKMIMGYVILFGGEPKEYASPIDDKDHPELDTTDLLDEDGVAMYQSMIGALQWAITLGRFDIHIAVTTMSGFRVQPRLGHLERLKRIYGYLKRQPDAAIRFRTGIPDHEGVEIPVEYDWQDTVYGNEMEEIPEDMPEPKRLPMRTTTYEDANLMHDLITGKSMTGIIHLVNQTPISWFSKKQNVVETATYGSEFMAARQATEQIMDLRYTLRMMGIPLDGPAWMFGDNKSVITSGTLPQSKLNKRHNALSYHRVRSAIACKILYFLHIDGVDNPSDVCTKFLSRAKLWPLVAPLLFWSNEMMAENMEKELQGRQLHAASVKEKEKGKRVKWIDDIPT
jgi:hypothetical protein